MILIVLFLITDTISNMIGGDWFVLLQSNAKKIWIFGTVLEAEKNKIKCLLHLDTHLIEDNLKYNFKVHLKFCLVKENRDKVARAKNHLDL